jgi:hypothetical protein
MSLLMTVLGLLVTSALRAAEQPAPPVPAPAPAPAAAPAEDVFAKKYALKSTGQRDPFTIWKENTVEVRDTGMKEFGEKVQSSQGKKGPGDSTGPVPPPVTLTKMVDDAYKLLYDGDLAGCIKKCDDVLTKMEDPSLQGAQNGLLQERCLRIQKAAKKLKLREEVEKEFSGLPIKIEGIVWRPKAAFAVINGKVRSVGEIEKGARIYQINPQDVVFVYKGFKVSKKLFEGGKTDGAKAPKASSKR